MSGYRILYHHRIRADDGQAVHVRELIEALRDLGHEVLECALVPKASMALGRDAGERRSRWQRVRLPRWVIEVMEIGYDVKGMRMLQRAAVEFRPHFVYERHALHCAAGLRVARRLGVPLLLEVNSPMVDEMDRLGSLRFRRRARRTERTVLASADVVLPVTAVLRDRLAACGARAERCRVIGNGTEPDRYGDAVRRAAASLRTSYPRDAFLLGFVGYARAWHRLDLALLAMAQPGLERVHFVLIGSGPASDSVRQTALQLGLRDRVHELGRVASADLPAHLCALDAAIIPAINDYASPLKLFDSLAAGVITLAPDQANLREYIAPGKNGLLFAAGSVDSVAQALRSVVADGARAARIGAAGRHTLIERAWTWRGNAERVVRAFEELAR